MRERAAQRGARVVVHGRDERALADVHAEIDAKKGELRLSRHMLVVEAVEHEMALHPELTPAEATGFPRRSSICSRAAVPTIAEILRLYASLVGDVPYDALNVAMVEANLPGGHAPGYVAVINNPGSPEPDPAAAGGVAAA